MWLRWKVECGEATVGTSQGAGRGGAGAPAVAARVLWDRVVWQDLRR